MALRGEGDPRWVVRERQDGRNVNGWHWEDKDVTVWAQDRLKQLISSNTCSSEEPSPGVAVTSVESVDGDATLYNRKGVLKVLYDLKISGKWASNHTEEDDRTHGDFHIDLFDEDPDVTVSTDPKSVPNSVFKNSFVSTVVPKIQAQCARFAQEMYEGADQSVEGLTLPKGKTAEVAAKGKITSRTHVSSTSKQTKQSYGSLSKSSAEIVMNEQFTCKPIDWFQAFTHPPRLSAVTRSSALSEPRKGGVWRVMNGAAEGEYTDLSEASKIDMRWRLKAWGDTVSYGKVAIVLKDDDGKADVTITVSGVPEQKKSETEGFWRIQILQAMRVVMGWGSAAKFV